MAKFKITPEQYQEVLSKLTLQEIRLISSNMKFTEENNENALELVIDEKLNFQDSGDVVSFLSSFKLVANGKSNEKEAISIDCVYKAVYSKSTDVKISKDFVEIFENTSLGIILWPYFREHIHTNISKMNMPPLVLPMKRVLTGGEK